MSTKSVLQLIIAVFITAIIGVVIYFRNDLLPQQTSVETPVEKESEGTPEAKPKEMSTDRITEIEEELDDLKKKFDDQEISLKELSKKEIVSTPEGTLNTQDILATAQTKGSMFSTTSTTFTPMGMFLNLTCPKKCILWINFYTTSKNTTSANNVNSYGLFLNGQDQGIYTQASLPIVNGILPVSLNAALPVNAGTYTVEIQAKTTGGTLQSDISFLQIMSFEQ